MKYSKLLDQKYVDYFIHSFSSIENENIKKLLDSPTISMWTDKNTYYTSFEITTSNVKSTFIITPFPGCCGGRFLTYLAVVYTNKIDYDPQGPEIDFILDAILKGIVNFSRSYFGCSALFYTTAHGGIVYYSHAMTSRDNFYAKLADSLLRTGFLELTKFINKTTSRTIKLFMFPME